MTRKDLTTLMDRGKAHRTIAEINYEEYEVITPSGVDTFACEFQSRSRRLGVTKTGWVVRTLRPTTSTDNV